VSLACLIGFVPSAILPDATTILSSTLCVAVFQLQLILEPGPEWRRERDSAWKEAVTYAVEHPHLRVPPELAGAVGRERTHRRRDQTG
jgi:hypothetical protein